MFQTWRLVHILLIRESSTRHGVNAGLERHHGRAIRPPVRWLARLRAPAVGQEETPRPTPRFSGCRRQIRMVHRWSAADQIDQRGGCRAPLPAPDLHLQLRGYIFRREATSALRNILSERPGRPENPAGKRMPDARQLLVMRAPVLNKRPSPARRALSS